MSGKVQRTSEQCETHKEPIPYLTSAKHCSHPPNTECCAGYASSPFCALDASFFTVCARLLPCRAAATDKASRKCDGHLWRRRCSPFGIRPGRTRRAWNAAAPALHAHPRSPHHPLQTQDKSKFGSRPHTRQTDLQVDHAEVELLTMKTHTYW